MTDALSRLAARAVGQAPLAQPRLPARFESLDGPPVELVEEEVATRMSSAGRPMAARPTGDTAHRGTPHGLSAHRADGRPPAPTASAQPSSARDRSPTPDAPAAVVSTPTPAPAVVSSAVAVERPLMVRAEPRPAAPPFVPPHVEDERPKGNGSTVRIHIGRLEVRANLQQAPAPPPREAARQARELSLSDYLRGERDAR